MGSFSSKCRLRMATFCSGAYCFRCFFMRSLLYLTGRTPSPFPTEPEQEYSNEMVISPGSSALRLTSADVRSIFEQLLTRMETASRCTQYVLGQQNLSPNSLSIEQVH